MMEMAGSPDTDVKRSSHHKMKCTPFLQADGLNVVYKVLGVPNMIWGVANQWPEDVSQLLGHPIYDCTPTGYYGPEGCLVCVSWQPITHTSPCYTGAEGCTACVYTQQQW